MTFGEVVLCGGSEWARGGVEEFLSRLQKSWPENAPPILGSIPANTAVAQHAGGLREGLKAWVRALRQQRVACKENGAAGPRIIWFHYGNGIDLISIFLLGTLARSRLIVTAHCARSWAHLRSPWTRILVRLVLRLPAVITVLSADQEKLMRELGVTSPIRIPTLLGQVLSRGERPVSFTDRPARSLVFAGRLALVKGIVEAIQLVGELSERSEQAWVLDLFGTAEAGVMEAIEPYVAAAHAAGACINFHGWVMPDRLSDELTRRRYFVYLSIQDAFPLAVLEGLAAGTLPLVFDIPGTDEIIDKWGGIKVRVGNARALVPKILEYERAASQVGDPLRDRAGFLQHFGPHNIESAITHVLSRVSEK